LFEKLCSDDYAGTELTNEIERVIFSNLDPTDTLNTSSFTELRNLKTQALAEERVQITSKIRELIAEDETLREAVRPFQVKRIVLSRLEKKWPHLQSSFRQPRRQRRLRHRRYCPSLRKELQKLQTTVAGLKQRALKLQQLRAKLEQFKSEFEASRLDFVGRAQALGVGVGFDLKLVVKGETA